jgi:lipopolysaccharide/colanic/teichoic acid biosynthesis glycosyltransferase
MYRDAEQRLDTLLRSDPAACEAWSRHFKLKNDPRILPVVGKVLRSSSCDEIPQLVNVILGEMSIVGPRPFPDYHLAAMSPDFRGKRCAVMPGLTGLWQISDRSNADVRTQQQLDEFYINNRSVWLDWHILFNTLAAVVRRNGAY